MHKIPYVTTGKFYGIFEVIEKSVWIDKLFRKLKKVQAAAAYKILELLDKTMKLQFYSVPTARVAMFSTTI